MDLIDAIVDYAANGDDANAIALQAVLPSGTVIQDYVWQVPPAVPYALVQELTYSNIAEGMGKTFRLDEQTIQFTVYHNTRAQVATILDALEHAFINDLLVTDTPGPCIGKPAKDDRLISWAVDHYRGVLNLVFVLEVAPQ